MIEQITTGLLEKFFEKPLEWMGFWAICGINLFLLIIYAFTQKKVWLLTGFGGICIAIYVMLYLIIIQSM